MFAPSPLPDVTKIQNRLELIFPVSVADRGYLVRDTAARTVFVLLYINAVEGQDVWLTPKHVYKFTVEQTEIQDEEKRKSYQVDCIRPKFIPNGTRWYADNSREPIRDETLKDGFVSKGVVVVNPTVATTSSKGRYALREHFAYLFLLSDDDFEVEVLEWQKRYLSSSEMAKVRIMKERYGIGAVQVILPNGERRNLSTGKSSLLAKAVIEQFATRFFLQPAVLWISESGNKVVVQDDRLMRDLGLPIDQQRLLPDMVLADLGREQTLLVFVEIVYSDGPITEQRKADLLIMTDAAGYERENVAFVSAFEQRNAAPLKRRFSGIATDSLIWCMTEPDLLVWLGEKQEIPFRSSEWNSK
jgi:hypothetical protein